MVRFKTKILDSLFTLYLILFPFGQLLYDYRLTDLIVLIIAAITLFIKKDILDPKGKFLSLAMIGSFGLLSSLAYFEPSQIFTGVLYFIRLCSYVLLSVFISERFRKSKEKETIYRKLLIVDFFVVIFGFFQYFLIPDLRFLKSFGWDDHYFRLVSTFLDPAFTGIIFLVGLILSLNWYIKKRENKYFFMSILNLIAIALTYSRSTYLALVVSLTYFFLLTKKKVLFLFPILLLISIPFLPRPSSEGVKLERTFSIFQKFDDYKKAGDLFAKSPVYGMGFNNICVAREKYLNESGYLSHSCGGIDNSILFVAATSGIIGLLFLIEILTKVNPRSLFGIILFAVFIHGMFTNTLFYSFVMGILAITLSVTDKNDI